MYSGNLICCVYIYIYIYIICIICLTANILHCMKTFYFPYQFNHHVNLCEFFLVRLILGYYVLGCDAVYFGRYTGSRIPKDCIFYIYLCDNLKSCITLASEFLQELDNEVEYPDTDIFLFHSSRTRITIQGKTGYMSRLD
jgi:hypothetical protein